MANQAGCTHCDRFRAQGANFCGVCGRPLGDDSLFWGAGKGEFARRYTVDDVPGFWSKRLTVADNQIALVFAGDKLQGEVRGGSVDLGGLRRRIMSLGRAERMTAVVMQDGPVTMPFTIPEARTADDMRVQAVCRIAALVSNALVLYRNALANRDTVTDAELRGAMFPLISSEVERAIRELTLDQLAAGPDALRALEARLPRALDDALAPFGLEVTQVRVLNVNHKQLDELHNLWEQERIEELADEHALDAEDRGYVRERRRSAQDLRREQAETVEDVRARNEIRREAERLIIEGKMAHITNEEDFAEFLAEVDKQKLLREQDVLELRRRYAEANQDHDLERQHVLETLQSQRRHELTMLGAEQQAELARFELEQEIDLDTLRTEHGLTTERSVVEHKLALEQMARTVAREEGVADAEAGARVREIEHEADVRELGDLVSIKRMQDEAKAARIQREQDIAIDGETQRAELAEQQAGRAHARELERMRAMAELSTEALIAITGPEQAEMLAELKRTETLAGLSEEQILAMAAERSPEVAQAFVERFRAEGEASGTEMMQEMYERMLAEKDAAMTGSREDAQEHSRQMQRLAEEAMRAMRDTAGSAGRGETIVMGAGGATTIGGQQPASESQRITVCPNCHVDVEEGVKHCPNCGHKFFE